jgi:hypothetical protein
MEGNGVGKPEPVFVNVKGTQESILRIRLESIPRLFKRFTNTGSREQRTSRMVGGIEVRIEGRGMDWESLGTRDKLQGD